MIWDDGTVPVKTPVGIAGALRVLIRGTLMGALVFGGLFVLLLVRLIERPVFGSHRPVTPFITVFVCRSTLKILGLDLTVGGAPMTGRGAVVANHSKRLIANALNSSKASNAIIAHRM